MAVVIQDFWGLLIANAPIKSAVVVSQGDTVGLDSNGQVVLADADAIVAAMGFAMFTDAPGQAQSTKTGDAALTQKCSIYRGGIIQGAKGMSSLTIGGEVWLSATASTYTQTKPTGTTNIQNVGYATAADTVAVLFHPNGFKLQAAGNSTVAFI